MKLTPIKDTAEITTRTGATVTIDERLTMADHLLNARRLGATRLTFRGIETFIK